MLLASGEHERDSHRISTGILSVKQRSAVVNAVKSCPMTTGNAVHSNLRNFSPDKHVPCDVKSMKAVNRLVTKTRVNLMRDRIDGAEIDGSEGSMNQLADSLSLLRFIEWHNDPSVNFHLDEHQVVSCGHQFKDGVRFLNLTTPHLLMNLARAENCGWQKQLHMDGAFNWCRNDFGIIGIGMNSMGSHFNPVSLNIVNSESRDAIQKSWSSTVSGLFNLFEQVTLCESEKCGFCVMIKEQVSGTEGRLFREYLTSEEGIRHHFQVDKPSSDCTLQFFGWAKDTFGPGTAVQQCGNHLGREFISFLLFDWLIRLTDMLMLASAIAFKKKSFRRYFIIEENYIWFSQVIQRHLEAPTIEITRLLQAMIVQELINRGEQEAAEWYEPTWTGEHGNVTNATASYCGNNTSAGLEAHWRYMRRDTIGSAGSNMRVKLGIFIPLLTKYISDLSEKHASKVLNVHTGAHSFPSNPHISSKVWHLVQQFDPARLILSRIEGGIKNRDRWTAEVGYFLALQSDDMDPTVTSRSIVDLLADYHSEARTIGIARSNLVGVLLPSEKLLQHLTTKHGIDKNSSDGLTRLDAMLSVRRDMYKDLFHKTSEWNLAHPDLDVEDTLDVMESFVRCACLFMLNFCLLLTLRFLGLCLWGRNMASSCSRVPRAQAFLRLLMLTLS